MVDNNRGIAFTFTAYLGVMVGIGNNAYQRIKNLSSERPGGCSFGRGRNSNRS